MNDLLEDYYVRVVKTLTVQHKVYYKWSIQGILAVSSDSGYLILMEDYHFQTIKNEMVKIEKEEFYKQVEETKKLLGI